ncbi:MAG: hypothetical protein IH991_20155 [Planctomycetes bacterium]|nr:hypothetical protein [Planctomycetota bacterium]
MTVIAPVGALLLIYGFVLSAFAVAEVIDQSLGDAANVWWWISGFSAWAFIIGRCVNTNYISIHRFYRDLQ